MIFHQHLAEREALQPEKLGKQRQAEEVGSSVFVCGPVMKSWVLWYTGSRQGSKRVRVMEGIFGSDTN